MNPYQHIIDQWATDSIAVFDLYEADNIFDGRRELVEARGDDAPPIIRKGETVTASIAAQIAAQHTAVPVGEPVEVCVLVLDEFGKPQLDADGNAVTETTVMQPMTPVRVLSYVAPVLPDEDDNHCDMCGHERELFRVGNGWYCKTERNVDSLDAPMTCFDLRLAQMMKGA